MSDQNEKKRETITRYVNGNGSDGDNVQAVLSELASMDDAILEEAQGTIEAMLNMVGEVRAAEETEGVVTLTEPDAEHEHDAALYEALEKLAELLSEIRLYNTVQKMDPIKSALISRELGI